MSAKEVNRLLRANGMKEYGALSSEATGSRRAERYLDVAYANFQTHKYLSIKKAGKCFYDPVFLTRDEYEERYHFEGENECDGC
jgi:hypothetical protein